MTTTVRDTWHFSCTSHLNQLLNLMADQIPLEILPADRLTADCDHMRLDLKRFMMEVIRTFPASWHEVWSAALLQAEAACAGFTTLTDEDVAVILETLADQGFVARVDSSGEGPRYAVKAAANRRSG
ncbi:hypothetical protein ACFPC0_10710 [Streptomyces andamanensis]|uniref:Uncharacterized protein n=1 Tax=Streptomyces andamanensis TaxID=1565035 RepID=A0ABV8TCF4_9ACTN